MEKDIILNDMIEKILLDDNSLNVIKEAIDEVSKGIKTQREFREIFIKKREEELRQLCNLFPYYMKRAMNQQSIRDFAQNTNDSQLEKELQERNQFFEQFGLRIKTIYEKLKNLQEASVISRL